MSIQFFTNDFKFFLPEIFIIFSQILVFSLCIYVHFSENLKRRFISLVPIFYLFVFSFFWVIILNFFNLHFFNENGYFQIFLFNDLFYLNFPILYFKIFISLLLMFFFMFSPSYFKFQNFYVFEVPHILVLSIMGVIFFVMSNDFSVFYLSLELQSFPLYILSTLKRTSPLSIEAGLKYFILGSFSSVFLLFGLSTLYGFFGVTSFFDLSQVFTVFQENYDILFSEFFHSFWFPIWASFIFLFVGLFFKIYAVPFHSWAPDVYQGVPYPVMVFFNVFGKMGPLFVLASLFKVFFSSLLYQNSPFIYMLYFMAFLSLVLGTFSAFYQPLIKRFFAYASITHGCFFLLTLALQSESFSIFQFYFYFYFIFSLFTLFLIFFHVNPMLSSTELTHFSHLNNFFNGNPLFFLITSFFLLSMAGLPPLFGFYPKLYVFTALAEKGYYFFLFILIFFSSVSIYYYVRVIRTVVFENSLNPSWSVSFAPPFFFSLLICQLFLVNLFFFFNPDPLIIFFKSISLT